jgi:hypothetical protein
MMVTTVMATRATTAVLGILLKEAGGAAAAAVEVDAHLGSWLKFSTQTEKEA